VSFFVAAKDQAENLLGKPAVQHPQLIGVGYVLEVVIQNRDLAHAALDCLASDRNQGTRTFAWIANLPPTAAAAPESKAEEIPDFSLLIAGQGNRTATFELQAQMPERRDRVKVHVGVRCRLSEHQVRLMTGFCGQPEFLQKLVHFLLSSRGSFLVRRKQKHVVGITEVVKMGIAFDFAVETCKVYVCEDARAGASEGNAERRAMRATFVLIVETDSFANELKQVVVLCYVLLELLQKNLVVD
jgi:hypothetical protein